MEVKLEGQRMQPAEERMQPIAMGAPREWSEKNRGAVEGRRMLRGAAD
jgi:hypothetical protein